MGWWLNLKYLFVTLHDDNKLECGCFVTSNSKKKKKLNEGGSYMPAQKSIGNLAWS